MRGEFGGARLQFVPGAVRIRLQRTSVIERLGVERQAEQLVDGAREAFIIALIHLQQLRIGDDLVEPCGALERPDLLEEALVIARTLHPMHHELLAAVRQPIHLYGGIHDGKEQRRGDDREADQHEAAQ